MRRLFSPLFSAILWLSLLLVFFHWRSCNFFSFGDDARDRNLSISYNVSNRRMLSSKIDFSPFLKRHRHNRRQHHKHSLRQSPAAGSEIDPRYGAEKRLVPTGPNPLHHWRSLFYLFLVAYMRTCIIHVGVIIILSILQKGKKREKLSIKSSSKVIWWL